MEISVKELRNLLFTALELRGVTGADAGFIADDYLDGELEGKRTHGISKFLLVDSALTKRRGQPKLINRNGAVALMDGQRELGQLAARQSAELAVMLARENGLGLVALRNFARFGRLEPYGRIISTAGFFGMITNSAGPPVVIPYGSYEPLLGSNPVCFAFPATKGAIVIDFSTAERTWGEVRQAILENSPLSDTSFVDGQGHPTNDPHQAEGVNPFGGHKGYALCLSLELMAGTLSGTPMGRDVTSEYDLGAVFLAVDPSVTAPNSEPASAAAQLAISIRRSKVRPGQPAVRVPGEDATRNREQALGRGVIEIDDEILRQVRKMSMSAGEGLLSTKRTN